jgi:peptidoglycan/LPS O-acetylase OafA/YrhL
LDIQGLRMVAVITVLANHLWGWPHGGFVGVDVFFVISGFLITGNLLRGAERTGNVSFKSFYWSRIRRIVPAATVVLIVTFVASTLVFLPFRAEQVGIDALVAFVFMSNWWFAANQTDYFAGGDAVSPVQHFWSLSVEEQFYFVWPALIFLIGLVVAKKAWTHDRRMRLAGAVMGATVAASLGWALYETATAPTWAYFNTFSRVWELGAGALLATAVGALARIPLKARPWLSWAGLSTITASVFFIDEQSVGFPAPWAMLPVAGAAMVIAAGVKGEPARQWLLRNPVSV